jgi:PKHD-type hydroxylase
MALYREFKSIPALKDTDQNDQYVPFVFLNNCFRADEIDAINNLWDEEKAGQAKVLVSGANTDIDKEYRNARKLYVHQEGNEWLYDKIGGLCQMMNAAKFRFTITGFMDAVAINLYEAGNFFGWHMDYGPMTSSNRKIAVVIQLSEAHEYEGGELQLITEKNIAPKQRGSIAMFPSYLLHRVTPVTSGCRKSLIAHIGGPAFR